MIKCPKCGQEFSAGVKFCSECGTPIPQQKECPRCHAVQPSAANFCQSCGFDFSEAVAAPPAGKKQQGMNIGDKNVIAGDVVGNQESYHIAGGATFITNSDETKKMVQCHVCGSNILIADSVNCPVCRQTTCAGCFDRETNMCRTCADEKIRGIEQ